MDNTNGLEQTLQDGKLYRHVNALIVAHLRDSNFNQVTLVNNSTDIGFFSAYLVSFFVVNLFLFVNKVV